MATTSTTTSLFYPHPSIKPSSTTSSPPTLLPFLSPRTRRTTRIMVTDFLGDFGARDPFPEELESNFGEKVLGNMSTEHKILIPQAIALALSQQSCIPVSPTDTPLSKDDAKQLLFKVIGWRLLENEQEDGKTVLKLTCLWKLKDVEAGVELKDRISKVVESAGHSLVFQQEDNKVTAVLWTQIIGGLSINDFIVAAKIDEVNISDLLPRKRSWA
ncbi:hypothetical protein SOVF_197400 [Spinacia oleracea]|uniref:4a-hydroxytetrahydrobiopterin dehydratase n=1 Tax=Spinacia oleracea TaxID=3562 RepID=A0A9R0JWF1_SPIOL|nr:probable pterin-4-alpha-carbinolamine dehydratase, chloroplastic [Spinacia oleracea]KNA04685.1 hypothetical protein SOVF_197400 [Spinacia oleracea]